MDIRYTQKLIDLFSTKSMDDMIKAQLPSITLRINAQFPEYPLPSSFEEYDQQSDFIVNSWIWLLTLVVLIPFTIINSRLVSCLSKPTLIRKIVVKIKATLQWNYCISTFVENYGGLVFYSSLQFLTASYCNSGWEVLSIVVCVCMNIAGLALLGRIASVIWMTRKRSPALSSISPHETEPSALQSNSPSYHSTYAIVLEDFKAYSLLQQGFFVVYVVRVYIFNLFIVYLFAYPIVQGVLFSLLTLCMLVYLAVVRPMKKMLDLINSIVLELILLVVNISVTVLSVLDRQKTTKENTEKRNIAEDIILWCNMIFFAFVLFYIIITTVEQIRLAYVKVKEWRKAKQTAAVVANNVTRDLTISTIGNHTNDSHVEMNPTRPSILRRGNQQTYTKREDRSLSELQTDKGVNFNDSLLIQSSDNHIRTNNLRDLTEAHQLQATHKDSSGLSLKDISGLNKEKEMDQAINNNDFIQQSAIHSIVTTTKGKSGTKNKSKNTYTTIKGTRVHVNLGDIPAVHHEKRLPNSPSAIRSIKEKSAPGNLQIEEEEGISPSLKPSLNQYVDSYNKNSNTHQSYRQLTAGGIYNNARVNVLDEPPEETKEAVMTNGSGIGSSTVMRGFIDRRSQKVTDYTTYMEYSFTRDIEELNEKRNKKKWR